MQFETKTEPTYKTTHFTTGTSVQIMQKRAISCRSQNIPFLMRLRSTELETKQRFISQTPMIYFLRTTFRPPKAKHEPLDSTFTFCC